MLWSFGALDRSRKISTSRHPCYKNVVIWPSQSQENVCFGSAHNPVEGPTVSSIGTLTVWHIKRRGFGWVSVSKNKSTPIPERYSKNYNSRVLLVEVSFPFLFSMCRVVCVPGSLRKQPTFATPTTVTPPNSPVNLGIFEAQHQTNCNTIVFNAI